MGPAAVSHPIAGRPLTHSTTPPGVLEVQSAEEEEEEEGVASEVCEGESHPLYQGVPFLQCCSHSHLTP